MSAGLFSKFSQRGLVWYDKNHTLKYLLGLFLKMNDTQKFDLVFLHLINIKGTYNLR
ncbi:MAG: hypothetical protein ACJARZ_002917 [Dokdonia sp.]|jgi:hypothetical protein